MRELFQQVREEIHALRLEMNEVRAELQNLTVKFVTGRKIRLIFRVANLEKRAMSQRVTAPPPPLVPR